LADSILYLCSVVDEASAGLTNPETGLLVRRIREERQPPALFARYLDLVGAVRGEIWSDVEPLLRRAAELTLEKTSFKIVSFSSKELGKDYQRFPEILFTKDYGPQPVVEIETPEFEKVRDHLESGLDLVSRIDPQLRHEIQSLWVRVFVGGSNPDAEGRTFGGVTSFLLWGATFLNAHYYNTSEKAVEFLVHEATHSLLFALSSEAPLVLNKLDERYRSPLRKDLRPMDGIFHATLVSARIACFMDAWLESGERKDATLLKQRREASVRAFNDGEQTILQHARLSGLAEDLLRQAHEALRDIA
jgi:hypothetical protein